MTPPPPSRIGKMTRRRNIDGSPLVYTVLFPIRRLRAHPIFHSSSRAKIPLTHNSISHVQWRHQALSSIL